jgi:hypothetical protein
MAEVAEILPWLSRAELLQMAKIPPRLSRDSTRPRLNRDRTKVVCGYKFPDREQPCQEWLAWWADNWDDLRWPKVTGMKVLGRAYGPMVVREGFRLVDGVWRETAAGRRRRTVGIPYRRLFLGQGKLKEARVICPTCRQERLLDTRAIVDYGKILEECRAMDEALNPTAP